MNSTNSNLGSFDEPSSVSKQENNTSNSIVSMWEKITFNIGATEDDKSWDALTRKNQESLDSKNFEGKRYAPYVEKITSIIEQEMGFKPDLRRWSLQSFDEFKIYQKEAQILMKARKNMDERGDTVQDFLDLMCTTIRMDIIQYNGEAWDKWRENLAKEKGTDRAGAKPYVKEKINTIRDRLAAEIPLLD